MKALWKKTIRDSLWLFIGCALVLFSFHLLRVWITSQFSTSQFRQVLKWAPDIFKSLIPVPLDVLASTAGRIGSSFDDPIVMLIMCIWTITRGSDAVSGELGRGTLEMLLAQPVRRVTLLGVQAAVTIGGVFLLVLTGWLSICLGLATIKLEEDVSPWIFLPASINLTAMGFFIAGLATLCSAADQYRWRTIGIVVSFYIVEMILRVVSLTSKTYNWVGKLTFLTLYDPQMMAYRFWPENMAKDPDFAWSMFINCNVSLFGLGLAAFIAAFVIFNRRDLPAPL